MKLKSKLFFFFLLILFSSSFVWGVGVGIYKWFPYFYLIEAKQLLMPKKSKDFKKIETLKITDVNEHIKSINVDTTLLKRKELINKVINQESTNDISKEKVSNNSEKIITEIYENKINAILTYSSKSKKCLKIYIQGHGGNPFHYSYHNKLLKFFLKEGCDFLSMSMLGLGLNEGNFSYPSKYGKITLNQNMAREHKNYAFFYDKKNPNLDPLTLFISPHYKIIKSLINGYEDVSMMGISGGGWYTVWLSALIPKIKSSISYAGSLPIEYRKFKGVGGDWEQQDSQIYNYISYWELYKLMTIDEEGEINRKAFLVYNDEDECCFYNPYAEHFKIILDELNWENLNVIIDKNKTHTMNVKLIKKIYQ